MKKKRNFLNRKSGFLLRCTFSLTTVIRFGFIKIEINKAIKILFLDAGLQVRLSTELETAVEEELVKISVEDMNKSFGVCTDVTSQVFFWIALGRFKI
jgi:hypothetical protein